MIRSRSSAVALLLCGALAACSGSSSTPDNTPPPDTTSPVAATLPPLTPASTLGCGLPAMPDLRNTCPKQLPRYQDDVLAAVDHIINTRSDLVDAKDGVGKVLDHRAYTNAVVERLRSMGYCAIDQLEEIAVKRTNDFNEQYNIWTSTGYVRKAYISTCFPAQF